MLASLSRYTRVHLHVYQPVLRPWTAPRNPHLPHYLAILEITLRLSVAMCEY